MHRSKCKKGNIAIKIDLYEAYDSVDQGFLKQTLIDFGFPQKIVDLIVFCVSASSLSLVWNGSRLNIFAPSRGLHQGDPMSPYLFILCMEKLSILIMDNVAKGTGSRSMFLKGGMGVSNLLFADDILLFV